LAGAVGCFWLVVLEVFLDRGVAWGAGRFNLQIHRQMSNMSKANTGRANIKLTSFYSWSEGCPHRRTLGRAQGELTKKNATQLTKLHISVGIGITLVYQVIASNPLFILNLSWRSESIPKRVGSSRGKSLGTGCNARSRSSKIKWLPHRCSWRNSR
jgi:hypothetical protein